MTWRSSILPLANRVVWRVASGLRFKAGRVSYATMAILIAISLLAVVQSAPANTISAVVSNPLEVTGGEPFVIVVFRTPPYTNPIPVTLYSHDLAAAPFFEQFSVLPPSQPNFPIGAPTRPVGQDVVVRYSVVQVSPMLVLEGQVMVRTPRVVSLSVSPSPAKGGMPTTATITLDGVAPANGALVFLASGDSGVVRLPSEVLVEPGEVDRLLPCGGQCCLRVNHREPARQPGWRHRYDGVTGGESAADFLRDWV